MKVAFLLHLYQPVTQDEATFRKIVTESYIPLVKSLRNFKDLKISFDIPLSLLEQLDKYGYTNWIEDIKELIKLEKVELAGSAAYHPLLSKLPKTYVEKEIILNEYALGYYFGRRTGFEGAPEILIKNLNGFFPPELAVNEDLIAALSEMNYEWVIVDETAIPSGLNISHRYGVYELKDYPIKIISRNRAFSNMLSFKRTMDMTEVYDSLNFFHANNKSFVTVLDAEFFGHHFNEGFTVLAEMLDTFRTMDVTVSTVGEYLTDSPVTPLKEINESTWGASDLDMDRGVIYPMWDDKSCKIHKIQWEVFNQMVANHITSDNINSMEEYETLPIWMPDQLNTISDSNIVTKIDTDLAVHRSLHSDQFWWASKKGLPTGQILYSPQMIVRSLKLYQEAADKIGNSSLTGFVQEKSAEIQELL